MSDLAQSYKKFPNKNFKDWALLNCFDRLYLYIGSLTKLDKPEDFQAVSSISRSIFELYIDLLLILDSRIEKAGEKFLSYQDCRLMYDLECLQKHRGAEVFEREHKHLAEWLEKYKTMNLNQKVKDLWGSDHCPEHWSKKQNIWKRIEPLPDYKYEQLLRLAITLYGYGSRNIHSGSMNLPAIGSTGQDRAIIEGRWYLIFNIWQESKERIKLYFSQRVNGIF